MKSMPDDDLFTSLLAEYDAALAEGRDRPASDADAGSPDLESAKECLDLLEAVWPRAANSDSATRRATCLPGSQADATTNHGDDTWFDQPRLLGRFEIVRELGRGGGGIVF